MDDRVRVRTASLARILVAALVAGGLFALTRHLSQFTAAVGVYRFEYAAVLVLLMLNAALAWWTLVRDPHHTTVGAPSTGRLLTITAIAVSILFVMDLTAGITSTPIVHWILLGLTAGLLAQTEEHWHRPLARWLTRAAPLVALAVLAAMVLRAHGIAFGLPYPYETDEHVFVNIAGRIAIDGDPNPSWFGHPGTTTIYALSGLYLLLYKVGTSLGLWSGAAGSFETFFLNNTTVTYLSGRLLMLALALVTIGLAYRTLDRIFGRPTALLATALLALSPLHTSLSRIIRTDIMSGLIILAVFWLCLDLLEKPRWRTYIVAGLLTGVGIATKYPTAIAGLVVLIAHLASHRHRPRSGLLKPVAFGGLAVLGAFLASPFLFLDSHTALADLRGESTPESTMLLFDTGRGWLADVLWYLDLPLAEALSRAGAVLAAIGFVLCLRSRDRRKVLVALFVPLYIGLIAAVGLRWSRWIVPTIPFLCGLAAYAVARGAAAAERRFGARTAHLAAAILVLGVLWPLLKTNLDEGADLSRPDTRTLAADWVTAHVPPQSNVLIEAKTPFLRQGLYNLFLVTRAGDLIPAPADTFDTIAGPYRRNNHLEHVFYRPFGHLGLIADIDAAERQKIEYMIVGSAYDRYAARAGADPQCAAIVAKYDSLMARGIELAAFERAPGKTRGPRVRVFQLAGRTDEQPHPTGLAALPAPVLQ